MAAPNTVSAPVPITVVIPTLNEEVDLVGCLGSVEWADERLIVDAGSRDETVPVARQAGARVVEVGSIGIARQRNRGIAEARRPWILMLDADERVSPELAQEVRELIESGPSADAYAIRRRNFFLGKEIRHGGWGSDWVVRLFRSGLGYLEREVHETLEHGGPAERVGGTIYHTPYRDVAELREKSDRYAALAARELCGLPSVIKFWRLATHPVARWALMYLGRAGFLDGWRGMVLSSFAARGVFRKYRLALQSGQ